MPLEKLGKCILKVNTDKRAEFLAKNACRFVKSLRNKGWQNHFPSLPSCIGFWVPLEAPNFQSKVWNSLFQFPAVRREFLCLSLHCPDIEKNRRATAKLTLPGITGKFQLSWCLFHFLKMDCICSSEKENAHGKCTSKVVDMVQAKEKRNVHFFNTKMLWQLLKLSRLF